MNADGDDERRLTNHEPDTSSPAGFSLFFQVEPAWSPDGVEDCFLEPSLTGTLDVFVMDADGTRNAEIDFDDEGLGLAPDVVSRREADRVREYPVLATFM